MNLKTGLTLLFGAFFIVIARDLRAQAKFEKTTFYKAIASEDEGLINAQLEILKSVSIPEKEAYEGSLLMRKAGLIGGAKEKLHMFKAGHKQLEMAIEKEGNNVEYRFLRLIIQENAPRILGYNNDIEKDSKYIRENFKGQSTIIKKEILDYSKRSKAIKPQDFQ